MLFYRYKKTSIIVDDLVLSNTLQNIPEELRGKVQIVSGAFKRAGGPVHRRQATIQRFLQENLIDEMIITKIPTLLGGGTPLFKTINQPIEFKCSNTQVFLGAVIQNTFQRKKIAI